MHLLKRGFDVMFPTNSGGRSTTPAWMMFWGVIMGAGGLVLLVVGAGGESREAGLVVNRGAALMIMGSLVGLVGWVLDVAHHTSV